MDYIVYTALTITALAMLWYIGCMYAQREHERNWDKYRPAERHEPIDVDDDNNCAACGLDVRNDIHLYAQREHRRDKE